MTFVETLSALFPAALALIGVWVGSNLSNRANDRHWLRERKVNAVSSFITDSGLLADRFRYGSPSSPEERTQWLHALQSGRAVIHLLCEPETIKSADTLASMVKAIEKNPTREGMERALVALKAFVGHARSEVLSRSELRQSSEESEL